MTALAPQGRYPSGMAPVTGTGVGVAMLLIKGLGLLGRSVNIASVSRHQEIGPLNHGIWESQSATAPLSDSAQSETHRQNDGKARNAEKRPHPTNVFGLVRPGQYPLPPPFADPTQPTAPPTPAPVSRTVSMLEACDTAHQPLAPQRESHTGFGRQQRSQEPGDREMGLDLQLQRPAQAGDGGCGLPQPLGDGGAPDLGIPWLAFLKQIAQINPQLAFILGHWIQRSKRTQQHRGTDGLRRRLQQLCLVQELPQALGRGRVRPVSISRKPRSS